MKINLKSLVVIFTVTVATPVSAEEYVLASRIAMYDSEHGLVSVKCYPAKPRYKQNICPSGPIVDTYTGLPAVSCPNQEANKTQNQIAEYWKSQGSKPVKSMANAKFIATWCETIYGDNGVKYLKNGFYKVKKVEYFKLED